MTPEAIDSIIAAVGKPPADRARLAALLNRLHYIVAVNRKTKTPNLKRIRGAIERAAKMVEANPAAIGLEPEITAVLDHARRLEAGSKGRGLSLTDNLCGLLLPQLFAVQFGAKATTARNGAYVKFAEAALHVLGEHCERETIIRSMTAVKKAHAMMRAEVGKNSLELYPWAKTN